MYRCIYTTITRAAAETYTAMQQLRILLADDDQHVRAGVRAFLSTMLRCEIVAEARNGAELLAQMAHDRPHVVVLDLRMPELDGVQAIRLIKAQWPATAVIALTLYSDHRPVALGAGADAFITKGDAPEHLIHTLRAIQRQFDRPADHQSPLHEIDRGGQDQRTTHRVDHPVISTNRKEQPT